MKVYNNKINLFFRLKSNCKKEWSDYVNHRFLKDLALDKLPIAKFRKYLLQDFLFLQEFIRILSLSSFKSQNYEDMNRSIDFIIAIKHELKLHINFCKKWGVSLKQLKKIQPLKANSAYTSYVLKVGINRENLDLFTCLAPCIIGYGEIGAMLLKIKNWKKSKYKDWIKMYSSKQYQTVAKNNIKYLDTLYNRSKKNNFKKLVEQFKKATLLEINFWNMI